MYGGRGHRSITGVSKMFDERDEMNMIPSLKAKEVLKESQLLVFILYYILQRYSIKTNYLGEKS